MPWRRVRQTQARYDKLSTQTLTDFFNYTFWWIDRCKSHNSAPLRWTETGKTPACNFCQKV